MRGNPRPERGTDAYSPSRPYSGNRCGVGFSTLHRTSDSKNLTLPSPEYRRGKHHLRGALGLLPIRLTVLDYAETEGRARVRALLHVTWLCSPSRSSPAARWSARHTACGSRVPAVENATGPRSAHVVPAAVIIDPAAAHDRTTGGLDEIWGRGHRLAPRVLLDADSARTFGDGGAATGGCPSRFLCWIVMLYTSRACCTARRLLWPRCSGWRGRGQYAQERALHDARDPAGRRARAHGSRA